MNKRKLEIVSLEDGKKGMYIREKDGSELFILSETLRLTEGYEVIAKLDQMQAEIDDPELVLEL